MNVIDSLGLWLLRLNKIAFKGGRMDELAKRDAGILIVLDDHFKKHRYPKLIELKEKVNYNKPLNDADLEFLHMVLDEVQRAIPSSIGHQDVFVFYASMVNLYSHIIQRALENEKNF